MVFVNLSTHEKEKNMTRDGKIVIVDDNEAVTRSLRTILSREFRTVLAVSSPALLPALLREGDVDIVLLDMNFGTGKRNGEEGLFWLERILERDCPPSVILITAFGDIQLAVSALKKGAADFVVKPWDNDKLIETVVSVYEREAEEEALIARRIVYALLRKYAEAYAKPLPGLTREALRKLSAMAERGDLSLLQQAVERAVLLSDRRTLDADAFREEPRQEAGRKLTLEEMERQFIAEVLREEKGNLSLAAQRLAISRQTLYNKIRKYSL